MKKIVIVFSGPSGAGKSTLISYLLNNYANTGLTISHTTRNPRIGEKNGVDYYYISNAEFQDMVNAGEFIEYVKCYGNMYGTSKKSIDIVLKNKDICILDLDYEGAYKVLEKKLLPYECVGILILPPSIEVLKKRLIARHSENEHDLNIRLKNSFQVNVIANYKYVIINNELEISKKHIDNILSSLR